MYRDIRSTLCWCRLPRMWNCGDGVRTGLKLWGRGGDGDRGHGDGYGVHEDGQGLGSVSVPVQTSSAHFVMISEFFIASKIKYFYCPFNHPSRALTWLHHQSKKFWPKIFFFKFGNRCSGAPVFTMVSTWCQMNRNGGWHIPSNPHLNLSNMWPKSRCTVIQKQGYLRQLSSMLLFNCDVPFVK